MKRVGKKILVLDITDEAAFKVSKNEKSYVGGSIQSVQKVSKMKKSRSVLT